MHKCQNMKSSVVQKTKLRKWMVEQELDPKLAWMESKKKPIENRGVSTSTPIMARKTDLTSQGLICYAIDFIMNFLHEFLLLF